MDNELLRSLGILTRRLGWWWFAVVVGVVAGLVGVAQQMVDSGVFPGLVGGVIIPAPVWHLVSSSALAIGIVAAFHRERLRGDDLARKLERIRSEAPWAALSSFKQVDGGEFGPVEWRLTVQNVGGAAGTFRAEVSLLRGVGRSWMPPWVETQGPEHTILPNLSGTLILFALVPPEPGQGTSLRKMGVEYRPQDGTVDVVDLGPKGSPFHRPRIELRVSSDPKMPIHFSETFKLVRGGIKREARPGRPFPPGFFNAPR